MKIEDIELLESPVMEELLESCREVNAAMVDKHGVESPLVAFAQLYTVLMSIFITAPDGVDMVAIVFSIMNRALNDSEMGVLINMDNVQVH